MIEQPSPLSGSSGHKPHPVLRIILPLSLMALSLLVAIVLIKTSSKPQRKLPGEREAIVEVTSLKKGKSGIVLHTTGTVIPSHAITLQARVSGEIIRTAPQFLPGGRFRKGEVILEIDPTDYQAIVAQRRAALAKAEYDLAVEQGMQDVAKHEWAAMQNMGDEQAYTDLDRQLALREPHLRLARENMAAAHAQLKQAELDLERTTIRAPFNAVIRSRNINMGSQVSAQTALAELAGTEAYWMRVTLPENQIRWVQVPQSDGTPGSAATITSATGMDPHTIWEGRILRKLPDLETAGRQAQLLVEVPHPDQPVAGKGTLSLGAYMRISITGTELDDVFSIPEKALRNGTEIWIMNNESRLEVRKVEIIHAGEGQVLIGNGVKEGEKLVLTDISVPLNNMKLATLDQLSSRKDSIPGTGKTRSGGKSRP